MWYPKYRYPNNKKVWKVVKGFKSYLINNINFPNKEISRNLLESLSSCDVDPEFQLINNNIEVNPFSYNEFCNAVG